MRFSRLAAIVLLAFGALGIGWLAIRAAVPPVLATRPEVALQVVRDDPEAQFRLAIRDYATTRRVPANVTPAFLQEAARRLPLSADPFVFEAIRALAAGDDVRATRLLEEARRRHPRHRLTRALLVERYARERRAAEAGAELTTLNRLVPEAGKVIGESLAELVRDPKTFGGVAGALRGDTSIDGVLQALVSKGADTDLILKLAGYRDALPADGAALWRGALVGRLINAGEYRRAKALWAEFAGVRPGAAGVFNAQFARLSAPPPFNWQLATGEVGATDFRRGGGMSVEFYGRASGTLLTQLITLTPGRHRLSFVAEGDAKGQSSQLVWTLRCAERGKAAAAGRELLAAPVKGVTGAPRRLAAEFVVPGDCPAQWLTLEGLASDFRDNAFVDITQFSVQPVQQGQRS